MKLNEILKDIKYNGIADNREITSITYDSRKIKENSLFIAISGEQDDGHDYILEAINSGATAVIANGRAPMTDLVPIMQVDNPKKSYVKNSFKLL